MTVEELKRERAAQQQVDLEALMEIDLDPKHLAHHVDVTFTCEGLRTVDLVPNPQCPYCRGELMYDS